MARVARRHEPPFCAYPREDFFPLPTVQTASQSDRRLPSSCPPKFEKSSGGGGGQLGYLPFPTLQNFLLLNSSETHRSPALCTQRFRTQSPHLKPMNDCPVFTPGLDPAAQTLPKIHPTSSPNTSHLLPF